MKLHARIGLFIRLQYTLKTLIFITYSRTKGRIRVESTGIKLCRRMWCHVIPKLQTDSDNGSMDLTVTLWIRRLKGTSVTQYRIRGNQKRYRTQLGESIRKSRRDLTYSDQASSQNLHSLFNKKNSTTLICSKLRMYLCIDACMYVCMYWCIYSM